MMYKYIYFQQCSSISACTHAYMYIIVFIHMLQAQSNIVWDELEFAYGVLRYYVNIVSNMFCTVPQSCVEHGRNEHFCVLYITRRQLDTML